MQLNMWLIPQLIHIFLVTLSHCLLAHSLAEIDINLWFS
jgi:hypothetical protein